MMAVAMFLLSQARARHPTCGSPRVYALILGLGLGMVMQVLVLAAQNAVDYRQIGVATSGSTLFRQIGGSIGVALFGSIFANRLHVELAARLPADAEIPKMINPAIIRQLPPAARQAFADAFAAALHPVFIVAAASPFSRSRSRGCCATCRSARARRQVTRYRRRAAIAPPAKLPHSSPTSRVAFLGNSQGLLICLLSVLPPLPAQRARSPSDAHDRHVARARARRRTRGRDHEPVERPRPRAAEDARSARRHRHRPDRDAPAAAGLRRRLRRAGRRWRRQPRPDAGEPLGDHRPVEARQAGHALRARLLPAGHAADVQAEPPRSRSRRSTASRR